MASSLALAFDNIIRHGVHHVSGVVDGPFAADTTYGLRVAFGPTDLLAALRDDVPLELDDRYLTVGPFAQAPSWTDVTIHMAVFAFTRLIEPGSRGVFFHYGGEWKFWARVDTEFVAATSLYRSELTFRIDDLTGFEVSDAPTIKYVWGNGSHPVMTLFGNSEELFRGMDFAVTCLAPFGTITQWRRDDGLFYALDTQGNLVESVRDGDVSPPLVLETTETLDGYDSGLSPILPVLTDAQPTDVLLNPLAETPMRRKRKNLHLNCPPEALGGMTRMRDPVIKRKRVSALHKAIAAGLIAYVDDDEDTEN